ncbi:WD domain protein [Marasmius sp. AFHP31]|nr:WD domain protein [Marasmius sp. AFHP31]
MDSETQAKDSPTDIPPTQEDGTVSDIKMQDPENQSQEASQDRFKMRFILSGHNRAISSLKFSPDGTLLASSGADKLIKIWDAYSGEPMRTFEGHKEGISDVAWSTDGEYLASASDDKTVKIWSMKLNTEVKTLLGHTSFVFCVNYNPRSNLLVSGGFDETVRVWDVARGMVLKVLPAHSDPVTAVSFNHDGTLIVSCSMDGLIRIWDSESGQCLKTIVDDDNPICSHVKFSANSSGSNSKSKYIVSGSEDNKAYVWNLQTRKIMQVLEGHRDAVLAVATHPTQEIIATASMEKDPTIRLWWPDTVVVPST